MSRTPPIRDEAPAQADAPADGDVAGSAVVQSLNERADVVMARHAKTFSWANRLMPRRYRRDFAVLYAFCRLADNIADESDHPTAARGGLDRLRRDLHAGRSDIRAVAEFLDLVRRRCVPLACAFELLTGVESDIGRVRLRSEQELLRYAYRVASTVGLMVCSIVDVTDPEARACAIDLGIAMQLTNISRDVVDDFRNDRVYLPAEWVSEQEIAAAVGPGSSPARARVYESILRSLELAERYYRSADEGMSYLPGWARWGILTAGRCYEGIGTLIRRRGTHYWDGRAMTPRWLKAALTARAAAELMTRPRYWSPRFARRHDPALHQPLEGLPEVNWPASGVFGSR